MPSPPYADPIQLLDAAQVGQRNRLGDQLSFVGNVVRLARQGQVDYLKTRLRERLGLPKPGLSAREKRSTFDYLRALLGGRNRAEPESNLAAAVRSFKEGSPSCRHLPVLVEYSDTFTGCNIYPPCGKCFSVPKPKIEYAFDGNDFAGLEPVLSKADVISLGSIAELTFDKNYPQVIEATSVDGMPRLSHPTNGILIAGHAERIVGKVRALQVSLDAHTPELYGKLQGKPGHLHAIEMGLRRLADLKASQRTPFPRVLVSVTVSRENIAILEDFYEHYSNPAFGVDVVLLSRLGRVSAENAGRIRKDFVFDFDEQMLPEEEYAAAVGALKQHARSRKPPVWELTDYLETYPLQGVAGPVEPAKPLEGPTCPLPWLYTQCSTGGGVFLCCYTSTMVGNWRQQGIEAVWNGPRMQQIRSEIAEHGLSRDCLEGTCPIVDRLDRVARESSDPALLDDLKKGWDGSVHRIRDLMPRVLEGTSRAHATLGTQSAPPTPQKPA